jgi:signal transduction histidine kinase
VRDPKTDLARIRGMSLERKLPLMMTAVLLVIVGGGVVLAYRELRRAAEVVSVGRLERFVAGLANSAAAPHSRVADELRDAAREPAIQKLLTTSRPSAANIAAARRILASLGSRADSGMVTELRSADGRVLVRVGASIGEDHRPPTAAVVTGPDSLSVSAFYESSGRVYYWSHRPVIGAGGRLGTIGQRRRLNAAAGAERDIQRLAGEEDLHVLLRNVDGSLWATLSGVVVPQPEDLQEVRGLKTYRHEAIAPNTRVILFEKAVERTPWVVAMELPPAALAKGPQEMLRRFGSMSILLVLAGAVLLWLVSRRITTPLVRLNAAAEGIARGDYSQRVKVGGSYEIARLGVSFNRMAAEIAAANKQLEETAGAAADAQRSAEAANASKSNFLAAMSHELRTPLNAIAGYVELLEMELRGPLTQEQRIDLARVKRSQKYLLGLIEEILVFSQLDAQRLEFRIDDVAVDGVVRDAWSMVEQQIQAKGVNYRYEACDDDLRVRADRDKLQQVIINLLVNATKYTDSGGSVTVSCESRQDRVLIRVADTGVGIPEEKLTHIFDAFVQLDRSLNKPREGVGLGLTISRDLARAMGGELSVESTLGLGSVFTLDLPAARSATVAGTPQQEIFATH